MYSSTWYICYLINKIILKKNVKKRRRKNYDCLICYGICSSAAIQVLYGPVKTFMNRFNDALNINYNKKGVTSTALCPGYTVTNFHTASGVQDEMDSVPGFLKNQHQELLKKESKECLKEKVVVPTMTWKIIVFLIKLVPQFILIFFLKY